MTLPLNQIPRFGSHFKGTISDTTRTPGNRIGITDGIVLSTVDTIASSTNQEVVSGRIDPVRRNLGYAYEIPGRLIAYSTPDGFDVVCLDSDDKIVADTLQFNCAFENNITKASGQSATVSLRKVQTEPVQSASVLDRLGQLIRSGIVNP